MKAYDFEHHFNHPELMKYLRSRKDYPYIDENGMFMYRRNCGLPVDAPGLNSNLTIEDEIGDLDDLRLSIMDAGNVQYGMVSASPAIEDIPKEESVKFAKATNDAISAACKRHPDRLIGSFSLPAQYIDESLEEMERAVKELGLVYWHTHSNYLNSYLYEDKYEPLFAKCAELGVPIYIHPNYPDTDYLLDLGFSLSYATFGFTVDTMRTTLMLIRNGLFDRYPNLQIILGHMGEFFPFCMDRMDNRIFSIGTTPDVKMEESITTYFKRKNLLVTTSGIYDPEVVLFTMKRLGVDSILFATDYPYEDFGAEYEFIKNLPITDDERDQIMFGNAERYIFKKPEAIAKYGPLPVIPARVSDKEALAIAYEAAGVADKEALKAALKEKEAELIPALQAKGLSLRQLAELMDVNRWALKEYF